MHYKNGREAKNGDKIVVIPSYGPPVIGILYDAVPGNDACNGRVAPLNPSDPHTNLKEVLHLDDVLAAVAATEASKAAVCGASVGVPAPAPEVPVPTPAP